MVKRKVPPKEEPVYFEYNIKNPAQLSPPSDANDRLDSLAAVIAFAEGDIGPAKVLQVAQTYHTFITTRGTH